MFKRLSISIILLLTLSIGGHSQTTDLLISEVIEGSSNNKYIEIYNGTGANVNLNNYDIRIYFNGSGAVGSTVNLNGTLATGNTYVIAHTSAVAWGGTPDLVSGSCNFNGDDAIELFNTSTSSIIDLVGNIGCDPGSEWSSGGNSTQNNTIVRNSSVCSGITTDPGNSGCPFPTLATEWTQFAIDNVADLGSHTETCSVACVIASEPTANASNLTFTNIGCFSMDLSWSIGNGANRIVVVSTSPIVGTPTDQTAYTPNTTFGNGDPIAAGEFVIYNGAGTSVTLSGLSVTTTYHIAIFEYNGAIANCEENYFTTGMVTGSDITLFCTGPTCPELTGILVDACGGAIEGINELFTFTNGNNSLPLDSFSTTFPSAGTYCNSGCGANTWVTNPIYVAQLNTTAACPGLFLEVDPIPANGKVIVFTGSTPTFAFDFSGLCGAGPYYAIFANNTSTSGRFANFSGCSVRTLRADFGTDCSDTVSYDRCLLTGGATHDGDFVTYDAAGNPSYLNNGCTPTAILPITLINFNGKKQKNGTNSFEWTTSSEINNEYFSIERSKDAIEFTEIGFVNGAGNSNTTLYYNFIDNSPLFDINYYRLRQTDFDGNYSFSDIIALDNSKTDVNIFISNHSLQINLDNEISKGNIEIYDAVGRVVYSDIITSSKRISIDNFNTGIYIVKVSTPTGNIIQKVKF